MKLINNIFPFLVCLLILGACDSKQSQEKHVVNPLAAQQEALQKAKAIEGQLMDAANKQRQAIEELTR